MARILKVFAPQAELASAAARGRLIEAYDAFVVIEASEQDVPALAERYPLEDITDQYVIHAGDEQIDTTVPRVARSGKQQAHPSYRGAVRLGPGRHHYLVQFVGPIKEAWLAAVRKAGGELRAPYGDFTQVVRADGAALARIAALPQVRWVGHLPPAQRIATSLKTSASARRTPPAAGPQGQPALPRQRQLPDLLTIEFFGADDLRKALPRVKRLGFVPLDRAADGETPVLVVSAPARVRRKIGELARVHGVRFIRERSLKRTTNDVAARVMGTAASTGNPGLALDGRGEIVAVCDTGLDTGDPASIHPDFARRVAWIVSYPITADFAPYIRNPGANDGPADRDSGHGTHVAGSILGDGSQSAGLADLVGPIRGLAHRARLIFQAVEQELDWKDPQMARQNGRYLLAGIPLDLRPLFADAYKKKARIHSNSWGGGGAGAYEEQCAQLDEFVWNQKDFLVLVAAGNDGTDRDGDGRINAGSVTAPGTAKNCLTVGASENPRPSFAAERYGRWWPDDYPAAPFRDAPMSDNADQVVAFSSRGPTADGRYKPDVVAPGTFILSTRSTQIALNNTAWAPFPHSRLYFYMGGTSMATPLAAGFCALLREYLRKKRKLKSPSAALLKAAVIAGAQRLPGTAASGTVVDHHQGFGRVHLDALLAPPAGVLAHFLDVRPGLRTGEAYPLALQVSAGAPLRIALAYSDFPGPRLVNNLNLFAVSPDGRTWVGNQREGGSLTADSRNNVEVVQVSAPAAGSWRVSVVASNVPQGPQDFALVVLGNAALAT